jgi:ABC-type dipeptide/oligopeptide/nickel transport system ATPase component
MRQRVVIAMALANDPDLIVADEPTTGLDLLVQAEILALLADLRARLGLSLLFISHDLPVVVRVVDRLAVMYRGQVVEQGEARAIAASPAHEYTRRLLASVPRLHAEAPTAGDLSPRPLRGANIDCVDVPPRRGAGETAGDLLPSPAHGGGAGGRGCP